MIGMKDYLEISTASVWRREGRHQIQNRNEVSKNKKKVHEIEYEYLESEEQTHIEWLNSKDETLIVIHSWCPFISIMNLMTYAYAENQIVYLLVIATLLRCALDHKIVSIKLTKVWTYCT